MSQGDNGSQALGQAGEKPVAQLTGGRLYTFAGLGGELLRVATIGFERQAKLPGRLPDECRVSVAVRASELVVEVGDDQAVTQAKPGSGEQMQQRHRVDAARDSHDDVAAAREEVLRPDDVAHFFRERMHGSVAGGQRLSRLGAEQQQLVARAGGRALERRAAKHGQHAGALAGARVDPRGDQRRGQLGDVDF